LGLWAGIAVLSAVASIVGFVAFGGASPAMMALVTAIAAGAILAMLVDPMIPEAFETAHALAGLVTVAGFLTAFVLSKADGQRDAQPHEAAARADGEAPGSTSIRRP
ncbi:MAG: hypothetical protein ABI175_20790, partial [Polyangiales bacterium]